MISSVETFTQAIPVWPADRQHVMNDYVGFRAVVAYRAGQSAILKITACSFYRLWINGNFVHYGPARAGQGHARVDVLDIVPYLKPNAENILAVEVTAYNVNTYVRVDEPAFLQAEVLINDKIAAATTDAASPDAFTAIDLTERVRKVQRYTFQRAFTEVYNLTPGLYRWRTEVAATRPALMLSRQPGAKLIVRNIPLPDYSAITPVTVLARGLQHLGVTPVKPYADRCLKKVNPPVFKGYFEHELECRLSQDWQTTASELVGENLAYNADASYSLAANSCILLDFAANRTGFLQFQAAATGKPATLMLSFDEIPEAGIPALDAPIEAYDVTGLRVDLCNLVRLNLQPGETYHFETMEPYTLRYLKITSLDGPVTLKHIAMRQYTHTKITKLSPAADPDLTRIWNAAVSTFMQNSTDIFTDCPSRERAGWLCDSFFIGRVAHLLDGDTVMERNFLENFVHVPAGEFPDIPQGMIPMCYPSDNPDGVCIPHWALWYILELEEYLHRSGDRALVDASRKHVEGILAFWAKYKNADGLIEKLPSWNFIEWSRANDLVFDVNYPSQMIYTAALDAAARLYQRADYAAEAADIRAKTLQAAYDPATGFFRDNAVRDASSKLIQGTESTEVCQYYAFFFNTATPQSHPELWGRLTKKFGPTRLQKDGTLAAFPQVHIANAFIGNYLRIELLMRYGLRDQAMEEIKAFFLPMVDATDTLWENMQTSASCNHGFASHVIKWMLEKK